MERQLEALARLIASRPGLVVSLVALVLILSAISAQNVKLTSGTESMFPKGNIVWKQYKLYEKDFGVGAQSLFVLIKEDNVVSRDIYEFMLQLQSRIEDIDGVAATVSPASILVKMFGSLPADESMLKRMSADYASDLLPKPTMGLIIIQLATSDADEQKAIAREVQRVLETSSPPPGLSVELTGNAALRVQIEKEVGRSLGITMTASVVLMVLILYATFSGVVRKKYTAFLPLVISVMSVQVVYGLMPILGIAVSEHTNGALPMLIGLAIEYGAQLQNRYEEERREGRSPDESVVIATTRTGLAIIMALLTTVIGFMSMLAPGIPAMAQFGIIASLGLIFAYVFTVTFLPAILKVIDRGDAVAKVEERTGALERSLSAIASLTASRPMAILIATSLIVVLGLYSSQFVGLETNYHKYIPQDLPAVQRFKELERVVGGQAVYTLVLPVDEVNAKTFEDIKELSDYIVAREDLVYDYDSITKIIDSIARAYSIAPNDALVERVMNSMPPDQKRMYVSGHLVAVHFYTSADTQDEYVSLYESIKRDVRFHGWSNFYVTGAPVLYGEMGRIMINGQTTMTVVAYVLVVALLLLVYRSIRKAIVPLIAITTVIAVMNVIMYVAGIKQTMMSIALNSITLGLGIDFSIHVLERYLEERRSFPPMEAVRRTIERTGKAITTSALTMAGGFGSLMFSTFPLVQNFGFIALVAIVFSLLAALTVVPAFLMVTERFSKM